MVDHSHPPSMSEFPHDDDDEEDGSPLGTLLIGLGCVSFAGYLFYYFTQFEAGDQAGRRMWWLLAFLYNIGGKWPPVGLVGVIGLCMLGLGVKGMLAKPDGT